MEQLLPNFVFFLFTCLPAFLFRPMKRLRFGWCFLLVAALGAIFMQSELTLLFTAYAALLGICLYFAVYKQLKSGKLISFCLCWGACLAVLNTGHLLRTATFSGMTVWLVMFFILLAGLAFSLALRWLSRWELEDFAQLSEDRRVSPLPMMSIILLLLLLLTALGGLLPFGGAVLAAIFGAMLLLDAFLWNEMSLALRHSQESSENSRQSRQVIDRASRSSEAELLRRLTESRNKLQQVSLAYQNNDEAALAYLLDSGEERSGVSYCSYLMLDAILREDAARAQKAGLKTDFKLQLGGMSGFSLADAGVMLDTVLSLLSEDHPGTPDVLRLRVQEWGDALVLTAGRRNFLYALPEEKMNVLRQLTEDYNGWLELTEKGMGICLFAVLFRPAEK